MFNKQFKAIKQKMKKSKPQKYLRFIIPLFSKYINN